MPTQLPTESCKTYTSCTQTDYNSCGHTVHKMNTFAYTIPYTTGTHNPERRHTQHTCLHTHEIHKIKHKRHEMLTINTQRVHIGNNADMHVVADAVFIHHLEHTDRAKPL